MSPAYALALVFLSLVLFLLISSFSAQPRAGAGVSAPCLLHQWEWLERAFRCRRCGLVCDSESVGSRREF